MPRTTCRGLSEKFMQDLQQGLLQPVLGLVKSDDTLSLCIRDEYVNVYYRGGSLLRIEPVGGNGYRFWFDAKYENGRQACLEGHVPTVGWKLLHHADVVDCPGGVALWLSHLPLLKQTMDFWFSANPKPEREFQQFMERTNNCNHHTDYYVVDIEYTSSQFPELRADMLAFWWPRTVNARRPGFLPRLTMVEVKQGDGALRGKAGVVDHVDKMAAAWAQGRLDFAVVAAETLCIFRQRVQLGLINCGGKEEQFEKISAVRPEEVDYLLLVADHDPDSTVLGEVLRTVAGRQGLPFEVKVALGSPVGFGLFTQKIADLPTAIGLF